MPIVSLLPTGHQLTSFVIDVSAAMQDTHKHPSFEATIAELIQWMQSYPRRSSIRVFVPTGMKSGTNRKLQSRLQSLGCIVTTKLRI